MNSFFTALCLFLLVLPACRLPKPLPRNGREPYLSASKSATWRTSRTGSSPLPNGLQGHGFLMLPRLPRHERSQDLPILVFHAPTSGSPGVYPDSDFLVACVGAGLGLPLVWAGVEEGTNRPAHTPKRDGLVVSRYEFMEGVPWPGMGVASGSPVRHYRIAGHPGSVGSWPKRCPISSPPPISWTPPG